MDLMSLYQLAIYSGVVSPLATRKPFTQGSQSFYRKIQNQMLDYGYSFMNTKIFIDNESTICIVKNPVFHSKTKHIEIRHHFISDSNEKKLIQMIKIHTYQNVADLLTKAFDVGRFQYLIATECAQMMLETAADDAIHFWQTATASTLANGEMEITATIDGKVKTATEASIRRC
ncbi:hypothetical protein Tco_0647896 [Tanacetum coccineum]